MISGSEIIIAGLAAAAAGLINALAGGGTLISFPVLIAWGVLEITANITNAVALCPGYIGGVIALCGIGQTIPELVYGHLGKDSIREIWLTNPVILGLREDLRNVSDYPGICGSCIHAKSCRTGCFANNYGYGGKLHVALR